MAIELNRCLNERYIIEWMTKGKKPLMLKDPQQRNRPINYKPIRYQPMMWKILTALIRKDIDYLFIRCGQFIEE